MIRQAFAKGWTYALVTAIALCAAYLGGPFATQVALGIAISAIVALSWDILSRTGQVSLGQAAFFGLGAYSFALLGDFSQIVAWSGVVAVCAIFAVLLGLLTLRLRSAYFSIATLGFSLSFQVIVVLGDDWTGGAGGIIMPPLAGGEPTMQLLVVCGLLLVAMAVSDVFLGRQFRAAFFMIRSKAELAAASGVPVVRTKIVAFAFSGVLAGLAGAAYAGLYGYIVPTDVFVPHWSVMPLAIAILGGMDSTRGPLIGAVLLRAIEETARAWIGGVGYQVVYGVIIIVFIVVMPMGVLGMLKVAAARFASRSDRLAS